MRKETRAERIARESIEKVEYETQQRETYQIRLLNELERSIRSLYGNS